MKSLYPLPLYLGASLSSLANVAERIESFSPESLPTMRTSRPTCAASGARGTSARVWNLRSAGSKRKKAKS